MGETYITPTDLKQYLFCPRVTYFTRVARFRTITGSQIEAGKKSHETEAKLESRRKKPLKEEWPFEISEKKENIPMVSETLGTRGILDLLLITSNLEYIPVEFKRMRSIRGRVHLDHKYQLTLLSLLIEEEFDCIIRRGIVRYLPEERNVLQRISEGMKRQTKIYVRKIGAMLLDDVLPEGRKTCTKSKPGCGFSDLCIDL